jgi:hypothetical protein
MEDAEELRRLAAEAAANAAEAARRIAEWAEAQLRQRAAERNGHVPSADGQS